MKLETVGPPSVTGTNYNISAELVNLTNLSLKGWCVECFVSTKHDLTNSLTYSNRKLDMILGCDFKKTRLSKLIS